MYEEPKKEINKLLKQKNVEPFNFLSPLLKQASIAKYCNRTNELNETLRVAKKVLPADLYRDFIETLNDVIPREMPERLAKRIR